VNPFSIFEAARGAPGQLAILAGRGRITFAELAERVRERARALPGFAPAHEAGLIALSASDDVGTLELIYALLEQGHPFLPLHSRLTSRETEEITTRVPVQAILHATGDGGVRLERVPEQKIEAHQRDLLGAAPQLAAIATSGSSGTPSVVLLSRAAFVASAQASAANLGWLPEDRWLLSLPLAHIGGLSVLTRCLLARRAVVLPEPLPGVGLAERLAQAIQIGAPTLLSLVPTQLSALLALEPALDLPQSVRVILTGGAALSRSLLVAAVERGWPVLTSYGLSEACSQVATQALGTRQHGELGSGRPLPGIEVRVIDGVIQIRGPNLSSGYLAGPRSPFTSDGWFQTRDLGRFDADGNLHVIGRADHTIISGGENVAPDEVESALEACPGVVEACVFPVPDAHWGQRVAAGLRVEGSDPEATLVQVRSEMERQLASFKRPRHYALATRFVYGRTGKLDRRATADALLPVLRPPLDTAHARERG
jgi:O-succinylbenzoic acid--CoA ligase